MAALLQLLRSWFAGNSSPAERDEAYLAESVDLYDLERRMRELDQRARAPSHSVLMGSGSIAR